MYGTLSVLDSLAASQQTIQAYGEDNAAAQIARALVIHNQLTAEAIAELAEVTSDNLRSYGGTGTMAMEEVDEFGAVDVQKIGIGATVGFPLRKVQIAIQWTRTFMLTTPATELAKQFNAARTADVVRIMRDVRRALFTPTNNLTYRDRLFRNAEIPLRALVNADGTGIPMGPNGEAYDGATHTHYLANTGITAASTSALIETVVEHGIDGVITLAIARGDEAAIRALPNFEPYVDARIISGNADSRANGSLNMTRLDNRAIGVFGAAEVWVKSWVPTGYQTVYRRAAVEKPLAIRTRSGALDGLGALAIAADHEHYPLRAQHMEREYGVGVWTRTAAAVLFTGGASYVSPTIA